MFWAMIIIIGSLILALFILDRIIRNLFHAIAEALCWRDEDEDD